MTGLGDIIAQKYFNPEESWDYVRTVKFGSVGAFYRFAKQEGELVCI